uniref:Dirigent protein n=1 Tax=Nymphaea colorata TaxID=210225 RepID=A0A5K1F1A3_9MAGN|nr:unnamed protein product [Nymphaea colorata]
MAKTNIVCYMHDLLTGKNVTAVPVTATANSTGFGTIVAIDDAETKGPNGRSAVVQGSRYLHSFCVGQFRLPPHVLGCIGPHRHPILSPMTILAFELQERTRL